MAHFSVWWYIYSTIKFLEDCFAPSTLALGRQSDLLTHTESAPYRCVTCYTWVLTHHLSRSLKGAKSLPAGVFFPPPLPIFNPLWCPTSHPHIVSNSRWGISFFALVSALLTLPRENPCILIVLNPFRKHRIKYWSWHNFFLLFCFAALGLMCTLQGFLLMRHMEVLLHHHWFHQSLEITDNWSYWCMRGLKRILF